MAHPRNSEEVVDSLPFSDMVIDEIELLDTLKGRYQCPKCLKSRKFFCYTCYLPHPILKSTLPQVNLPLKIDIIKHQQEIDGKSTAAHAAILASNDVTIYTYPDIPIYDEQSVVLIYPSNAAVPISALFSQSGEFPENCKNTLKEHQGTLCTTCNSVTHEGIGPKGYFPIKKAVFIDSTWNQSRGIYKDPNIRKLQCVILQNRVSQFWRHQKGSPRWYLATIEAVHQFVIEMHINAYGINKQYEGLKHCMAYEDLNPVYFTNSQNAYNGQYDNLLYFFKYMYKLIHEYYTHDQLHAYKRRLV